LKGPTILCSFVDYLEHNWESIFSVQSVPLYCNRSCMTRNSWRLSSNYSCQNPSVRLSNIDSLEIVKLKEYSLLYKMEPTELRRI